MIRSIFNNKQALTRQCAFIRCFTAKAEPEPAVNEKKKLRTKGYYSSFVPEEFRFQYREFLPDPHQRFRNSVLEKLMRKEMLDRRTQIHIPEFYVGSIVAVTSSDPHSQGKTNRFLGICIDRDRTGLRARFTVRNCVDNQGLEIQYEMYDPTVQKIEVIRLEKRLDEKLFYLRDALPEFSTFDLNMEPENLPDGAAVPINDMKVKLKPRPWLERWERQNLQGVDNVDELLYDKHRRKAKAVETPWEKYDLMKEYRRAIPEEEQVDIFSQIYGRMKNINEDNKKKMKARRAINKPQKLG